MSEKLFVSDEALEKYGYAYFNGMEADDYELIAENEPKKLEDGLLVCRDDMYNIYLSVSETDESFNDVEDIADIIYIDAHVDVFNMRVICERAGVGYSTFRNWKSAKYKGLNSYKIERIVEEMRNATN